MSYFIYDVALSFAGEDRDLVRQVADILRSNGINVFYDEYERANLWGKELIEYLEDIYKNKSRYVMIFVSKSYLIKDWTNHERKSALNRAFEAKREYILPIRLDNTTLPGLHDSIGYLSGVLLSATDISVTFLQKLGRGNISVIQSSLSLYRLANRKLTDDFGGKAIKIHGSRWSSPGQSILYTSNSRALAMLETLVHLTHPGAYTKNFVMIQYLLPSNLPMATVYESDLEPGWNKTPTSRTRTIGDLWIKNKETCILSVPSAVTALDRNYLLNPDHESFQALQIGRVDDFVFDQRLSR